MDDSLTHEGISFPRSGECTSVHRSRAHRGRPSLPFFRVQVELFPSRPGTNLQSCWVGRRSVDPRCRLAQSITRSDLTNSLTSEKATIRTISHTVQYRRSRWVTFVVVMLQDDRRHQVADRIGDGWASERPTPFAVDRTVGVGHVTPNGARGGRHWRP